MTANFASILSAQVDETERPKPLPAGNYICTIVGHEFGESSQKKTPYCRFNLRPIIAMDDVDPAAMEHYGGLTDKSKAKSDYYLTEDAMFMLQEFLRDSVGIEVEGRSYAETIPETTNQQVGVTIELTPSQDGQQMYANVSKTFKPEG